ncbi:MAG: MBL fold metallo-hydrolase [Gemmatimonadetes bacterium]|nr:MBL fold metallo-hydrolase [Gemmatimonadota bacterium]
MKLHFLGTGTSFGVPVIGCSCTTCRSTDPRDKRTRHAALLEHGGRRLLVDTPPELRLQLLRSGIPSVDAVWYTHHHADHVHGIDDLRVFSVRDGGPLEVYASDECADVLSRKFDYVFDPSMKPTEGTTRPEAQLHILTPFQQQTVAGFDMLPVPVPHGPVDVYGFRVGDLGYLTDAKRVPDAAREALAGIRVLVVNALWFGHPHPTHFNVEEAVDVALDIGAERTFLIHMSHRLRHAELLERLPPGVVPAQDGLVIEI